MIGIDAVGVGRFARICPGPDCHFAQVVFTVGERRRYGTDPAQLALCFSAKEAVGKALGTGLTVGPPPGVPAACIEVVVGPATPSPSIVLHGQAWAAARKQGFRSVDIAWARCGDLAISCAIGVR
jgi:phosphopantetheine--protein transferase-like protein